MRGLIKFFSVYGTLAVLGYLILHLIISGIGVLGFFLGILFVTALLPSVAIAGLAHLLKSERRQSEVSPDRSREGKICPYCQNPVGEREIICTNCYEDLAANCSNCGQIVHREAKVCPRCGISLLSKATT